MMHTILFSSFAAFTGFLHVNLYVIAFSFVGIIISMSKEI